MTTGALVADVDFLIIGAYKSGTTYLYQNLGRHPEIDMASVQEPNYFAQPAPVVGDGRRRRYDPQGYRRPRVDDAGSYDALFTPRRQGVLRGECSPEYLRNPVAPGRISESIPGARVVALLRNPVDRALSDYAMFVRDGLEVASFEEAVRRPQSDELLHHYLYTGFYGRQLKRYFEVMRPEQIKVILFEELVRDPSVLTELLSWLGVSPQHRPMTDALNVSGRPRNKAVAAAYVLRRRSRRYLKPLVPGALQRRVDTLLATHLERLTMDDRTRQWLVDLYREDVGLLSELMDRDLRTWLR